MPPPDAAARHHARQQRLTAATVVAARREWARLGTGDFDTAWRTVGPRLLVLLVAAQRAAARDTTAYLPSVLAELDIDPTAAGEVNVDAFVGVASDGRRLDTLLYEPVIAIRSRIGAGADMVEASLFGRSALDMIVQTQITDAARGATSVGMVARPAVTRYVRMLNPPACSRCSLLAGRSYRMEQAFLRHPRCDCRHVPATEDVADDLTTDTKAYFKSLSEAEQNRIFTNAGAEAIRDGADIGQVVNARRGMTAAGTTTEGTTRRGRAGRRLAGRSRLTPEAIYERAGSRSEAIDLLRQHSYLL